MKRSSKSTKSINPQRSISQTLIKQSSSPSKKHTEVDPLAVSQVPSEHQKSQQSFRSSNSPNGLSPTSKQNTSMISSGGVQYKKRHSSIISKGQLNQMHERSVIKLLGLNLEAVCPKPSHDKNKMLFICQLPECQAENRLGCAYCQLESHGEHPTQNIEIQQFCRDFDEKYKEFQNIAFCIQQTPNMTKMIQQAFDNLRQQVLEKIQSIEMSVISTINSYLIVENRHQDIINRMEVLSKKNIFEMTQEELFEMLEFNRGKQSEELSNIADWNNQIVQEKTQQANIIWDSFFNQLENDVLNALGDNGDIFLMDPNSREYATLKLQRQEQKKRRLDNATVQFKDIVDTYEEQEKIRECLRLEQEKLQREMILRIQEEEDRKKYEEEKKQEEEKQKKQIEEAVQERERILRTFPHIIYTQDCNHRQPCNTIPIFSCCNKAYPCVQCHGYASHPPKISVPSYRYCMKCLEIYLVIYPTNIAVNCLKCS